MSDRKFEFGDRVRHARRPEWGIGSVVKAELVTVDGDRTQRVSVRFPNAGLKTLSTSHAELQLIDQQASPNGAGDDAELLAGWERMDETDWLAPVVRRKVDEAMVALSSEVRDPFQSLPKRFALFLDLYRFERTGRSLVDWAIAQSRISDPLSRFTRHELEALFDRWAANRDKYLHRLIQEARSDPAMARAVVASASPAAREAVRRLTNER